MNIQNGIPFLNTLSCPEAPPERNDHNLQPPMFAIKLQKALVKIQHIST